MTAHIKTTALRAAFHRKKQTDAGIDKCAHNRYTKDRKKGAPPVDGYPQNQIMKMTVLFGR